ncbi:MAG: hypothetical protein ETSY1_39930 [Candidatus Entotheonella factor]|uniref:Uncharacterized protein n=1 Tax=Entotheonella factor TaxID=1429438 RepID=W4L5B4_ENTF1|nr:MAG: hypothetical protein ETSY1_39930 [Candidatus Entotheonella factor]
MLELQLKAADIAYGRLKQEGKEEANEPGSHQAAIVKLLTNSPRQCHNLSSYAQRCLAACKSMASQSRPRRHLLRAGAYHQNSVNSFYLLTTDRQ